MMASKLFRVLLVLVFLMGSVSEALAAKRLGRAGNLGQQRGTESLNRAPAPQPSPPSAVPGAPNRVQPVPAAPVQPMPPQRNSWWGPIAGFAGGALLGSLFFGHGGFGGGGGGGFLGILLFGLVGVVLVMVIRRFLVAAPPAQELYTPAPRYPDPAPMTSMNTGGRPPLALPPGFDLEAFIHQAKVAYIRLQAANDAGDLNDLRAFTTPEMFAEISLEIQARHGAPQRVEVLQLDAELLDLSQQGTVALATVQYFVTAREDGGVPESYTELWHVRKLLADSHSSWLLAGIEQI